MRKLKQNKKTMTFVILILAIVLMTAATSCTEKSPTIHNPVVNPPDSSLELVQGEVSLRLRHDVDLEDFLISYSEYELTKEFHGGEIGRHVLSFNYHQISGEKLIEILLNDPIVGTHIEPYLMPGWIHGELLVILSAYLNDEDIERFVSSFSQWDLKIISSITPENIFRLSFNPKQVNEFEFRRMIRQHWDVNMVDFNGPQRLWISGELWVVLYDDDFERFIDSYSDLDIEIDVISSLFKILMVKFDYMLIDEFELYTLLKKDPRITSVSFSGIQDWAGE